MSQDAGRQALRCKDNSGVKLFDVVGALVVTAWVGALGAFIYTEVIVAARVPQAAASPQVAIAPGESWLLVTRQDKDVGFIHETRTPLEDGWLLEHDLSVVVELQDKRQLLQTQIKARVKPDGELVRFSATYSNLLGQTVVEGQVREGALHLKLAGDQPERVVPLSGPVRLLQGAHHQLARQRLEPGQRVTLELFDPVATQMTRVTYRFVERRAFESFSLKSDVLVFSQEYLGQEQPVFVSEQGELWATRMPLQLLASKIPRPLAKARISSMQRDVDALRAKARSDKALILETLGAQGLDPSQVSLDRALRLMGDALEAQGWPPHTWLIAPAPDALMARLTLTSQRQRRALPTQDGQAPEGLPVTTGGWRPEQVAPWAPQAPDASELAAMLEATVRVDHDHDSLDALVQGLDPAQLDALIQALGKRLRLRLQEQPVAALTSASQALAQGQGDCTEFTLISVAALRRVGLPARFVHGLIHKDGAWMPHQWTQVWDASQGRYLELDATRQDLTVGPQHLQLMVSASPEAQGYIEAIDQLVIRPITSPSPSPSPSSSP